MRRLPALLQIIAIGLVVAANAHAEWQPNGVGVCTAGQQQSGPQVVSDGAGGALITWYDYRGMNGDIFAQRVDAAGNPLWAENGVSLCAAADDQVRPTIATDGAGGAIVVWHDARFGDYDIYAQRVDPAGNVLWASNGVALCSAAVSQVAPLIIADGAGGAIIAWHDYRSGTDSDIYAQRVDGSGAPLWATDGVALCTAANDQLDLSLADDNAGGAIVTWADSRTDIFDPDIYAQRVDASGSPAWTSHGIILCNAAGYQYTPTIVANGAGGGIVAWSDFRNPTPGIYAQEMDAAGVRQWTMNGAVVATFANSYALPSSVGDGAGGAIITWSDGRDGSPAAYVQRMNAAGAPQWTPGGVALAPTDDEQSGPRIVADGAGGAIIAWYDGRNGGEVNYDIYAQRVDAAGEPQWALEGIALCSAGMNQSDPMITGDGAGGAIVTWQDSRDGNSDIYASLVNGNTEAGANVVVVPVDATTGTTPATVTFDDVGDGSTSLVTSPGGPALPGAFLAGDGIYYNLSTTAFFSGNVEVCITYDESGLAVPEASVQLIHYDTLLESWVDITTSLDTALNQVCGVTTSLSPFVIGAGGVSGVGDDPMPAALALQGNFPNPFNPTTTIAFDVPASRVVRIVVHDVAGRRVRSLVDQRFPAGTHRVTWDGRDDAGREVTAGVYLYRMEAGPFVQTNSMVLLK